MDSIVSIIKDWPVIIQGALGSALFWLLLVILQKLSSLTTHKISLLTKGSELTELKTELLKIQMNEQEGIDKLHFAAPLLYRMARPFLKSMLWLVLGLLLGSTVSIFGIIGYIGSIYYLVEALNVVSPYEYDGESDDRKSEVKNRIAELENDL